MHHIWVLMQSQHLVHPISLAGAISAGLFNLPGWFTLHCTCGLTSLLQSGHAFQTMTHAPQVLELIHCVCCQGTFTATAPAASTGPDMMSRTVVALSCAVTLPLQWTISCTAWEAV